MYIADLHLHSRFSRACSKDINVPNLAKWAKIKGLNLLGTGDCLHPIWQKELQTSLTKFQDGFYEFAGVKFVATTEVSCIYSDQGKVKRIHLVLILPSLESANKISLELIKKGVNLASDGRPIMGLSAHDLVALVLTTEPQALIIPAHIWTPWFSLFGSNSGYDFFNECFKDLSSHILAVETGLSSEPAMNWRIADLDHKAIVSFSDAHSLPNLGREATVFKGGLSFAELKDDLLKQNINYTIEFFPEEGKYHYSGHRDCGVVFSPEEVLSQGETCPKCGKKLTIGVAQRIEKLATRASEDLKLVTKDGLITSAAFSQRPGFKMLIGLEKIIADSLKMTTSAQKVKAEYNKLIEHLDNEINILTTVPIARITSYSGQKIAEGVEKVRHGEVEIKPGFDNTYGEIKIWGEEQVEQVQQSLF
ncbi:endonuclease Q family protein [Patescibacteria group bacterium]|nr:endonuclease Q family protein [Patescibacteria group bacterium]MCL5409389.1 endonuclease Q family protein [Patescibacteria group bacterium]